METRIRWMWMPFVIQWLGGQWVIDIINTHTRNTRTNKMSSKKRHPMLVVCLSRENAWNEDSEQWRNNHIPLKVFGCHLISSWNTHFRQTDGMKLSSTKNKWKIVHTRKVFSMEIYFLFGSVLYPILCCIPLTSVIANMITIHSLNVL